MLWYINSSPFCWRSSMPEGTALVDDIDTENETVDNNDAENEIADDSYTKT